MKQPHLRQAIATGAIIVLAACSSSLPLASDAATDDSHVTDAAGELGDPSWIVTGFEILDVSKINWNQHQSRMLLHPHFQLAACDDHFPTGAQSRTEIANAAAYYNAIEDLDLSIEVVGMPHLGVDELYAADRQCTDALAHMDYTYEGFPCHARNENGWTNSFAMNACSYSETAAAWGKSGAACFFNVAVDPYSRNYDEDLEAGDYPKAANIAHEVGHGFGMIHAPNWPEADKGLISTMQGNLNTLGSYDVAFLRQFYGKPNSERRVDLAVSPIYRGVTGEKKIFFGREHVPTGKSTATMNPRAFYVAEDLLLDCQTNESPLFSIAIFNRGALGTAELEDPTAFEGELRLTTDEGDLSLPLVRFRFPELTRESQLQWQGAIAASPGAAYLAPPSGYKISLHLNTEGRMGMQQPSMETAVTIAADATGCP